MCTDIVVETFAYCRIRTVSGEEGKVAVHVSRVVLVSPLVICVSPLHEGFFMTFLQISFSARTWVSFRKLPAMHGLPMAKLLFCAYSCISQWHFCHMRGVLHSSRLAFEHDNGVFALHCPLSAIMCDGRGCISLVHAEITNRHSPLLQEMTIGFIIFSFLR